MSLFLKRKVTFLLAADCICICWELLARSRLVTMGSERLHSIFTIEIFSACFPPIISSFSSLVNFSIRPDPNILLSDPQLGQVKWLMFSIMPKTCFGSFPGG